MDKHTGSTKENIPLDYHRKQEGRLETSGSKYEGNRGDFLNGEIPRFLMT
jgi:hypothetical protein